MTVTKEPVVPAASARRRYHRAVLIGVATVVGLFVWAVGVARTGGDSLPGPGAAPAAVEPADSGVGTDRGKPVRPADRPADPADSSVDADAPVDPAVVKAIAALGIPPLGAQSAKPVGIGATAAPAAGLSVQLGKVTAVEAKATGVGEIAGPALAVPVTVTNDSDHPISLATANVTAFSSSGAPASSVSSDSRTKRFPTTVKARSTVTGTVVFAIPKDSRKTVTIVVLVDTTSPAAIFSGPLPTR